MSPPQDLLRLSRTVGLLERWSDDYGHSHQVTSATLAALLERLGYPCESAVQRAASLERARHDRAQVNCPLLTVNAGALMALEAPPQVREYVIELERGGIANGRLDRRHGDARGRLHAPRQAGYHRLHVGDREHIMAVAPSRAAALGGNSDFRGWGCAAQIHALRRSGDGGIGDFAAAASVCRDLGALGGAALGLSPSHAPFTADLGKFSPYAPSSRIFLNPLHADVAALAAGNARTAPRKADAAHQPDMGELIDWPRAGAAKMAALRRAFDGLSPAAQAELDHFRSASGEALQRHALFEAISHHVAADGGNASDWRRWPTELQQPDSSAVVAFSQDHGRDIAFHAFCQWLAERSLARARTAAHDAGLAVGLIGDLAIGADPGGAESWSRRDQMLAGLTLGAPPDAFNAHGQGWDLSGFSPVGLRRGGFSALRDLLRSSMQRHDALRIDHALAFARVWIVPDGAPPSAGGYLRMPLGDILRLVRLESVRNSCAVIGEDLGTVPSGLRKRLQADNIYGIDVLAFARDDSGFLPPQRWRRKAVAMSSTHDLPTMAGWWRGRDLDLRAGLDPGGNDAATRAEALQAQRRGDRQALWQALLDAGCAKGEPPDGAHADALIAAVLGFIGRSACTLALAPLEDALALSEQPNLPGTTDEYPNWRQRLPVAVERMLLQPEVATRLRRLAAGRREPQ